MKRKLAALVGMLLAGSLVASAAARDNLTANMGRGNSTLTVTGQCDKTCWLGISIYRKGDSRGVHQVRQVPAGTLRQTASVPFAQSGTYEVALWDKRVGRLQCKGGPCNWCQLNGYHMEGLRAYYSGTWGGGK